jgi:hypothetical protein
MDLLDIILLTSINIFACLAFPRLVSLFFTLKTKYIQRLQVYSTPQRTKYEITSFPYCTSYSLTASPVCKFRPNFCAKCSP